MRKIYCLLALLILSSFFTSKTLGVDYEINGIVPAQAGDFQFDFDITSLGEPYAQNSEITYTFTYGTYISGAQDITLQAEWGLGTIDGELSPSVDLLEYVPGSADNGYGGAAPTINTTSRTITWNISNFPGNTQDQTVSFKLSPNSTYQGSQTVSFEVDATLEAPGVDLPQITAISTYLFDPSLEPVEDQEETVFEEYEGPKNVIKGGTVLEIERVEVEKIGADFFQIVFSTNLDSVATLFFGTDRTKLTRSIESSKISTEHRFFTDGLKDNTTYYVKVESVTESGLIKVSDIFTVTTASKKYVSPISFSEFALSSNGTLLLSRTGGTAFVPYILPFGIQLSVNSDNPIKEGFLTLTNTESGLSRTSIKLSEISQGKFVANFPANISKGSYSASAKVFDFYGQVVSEELAKVVISDPLTVIDQESKEPVEGAKIYIFYLEPATKTYKPVSMSGIQNPSWSNSDGKVRVALPTGSYKITVLHPAYKEKETNFTLDGAVNDSTYPQVELTASSSLLVTGLTNMLESLKYNLQLFQKLMQEFAESTNLFRFVYLLVTSILLALLALLFSKNTKIRIVDLPFFIPLFFTKETRRALFGKIVSRSTGERVSNAKVVIIDAEKNKILREVHSNRIGEFYLPTPKRIPAVFKITVLKHGFEPSYFTEFSAQAAFSGELTIYLDADPDYHHSRKVLGQLVESLLAILFEILLALTFLLGIVFTGSFGLSSGIPLIALSALSLILWSVFLRRGRS